MNNIISKKITMKEQTKNVEINSEVLSRVKEKQSDHLTDMNNLKKDVLKQNTLLNFIDTFEKSPLFETINVEKWQMLFDEWSSDNNLYIIKKWLLSVEKYTTTERTDTKQLATLKTGDFLWEASLDKSSWKKEALIKALENTEVLAIDGKNDLKKFIEENPSIWYELLKHIITETNKRLLESNKIITTNYEIEKHVKALTQIDRKSIFWLIDKVKVIADVDYILYIEKHQVLDNFFTLKYDSRQPNKMLDEVFERKWYFLDLDELFERANICKDDQIIINKLSIGNEIYGYLILWREKRAFSGSDKKIFTSIANSFVWVLKKFFTDKEDMNKVYINEMKKI